MIDFINSLTKSIKGQHTPESLRRAKICAECPLKEKRFYADFLNAEIIEVQGYACTVCGCPIASVIHTNNPDIICDKWSVK